MTEHQIYSCPQPCDKPHCIYCDGGLAFCEVCKCGDGELPTECPGHPVPALLRENIMAGASDYRGGRWVTGKSTQHLGFREQL